MVKSRPTPPGVSSFIAFECRFVLMENALGLDGNRWLGYRTLRLVVRLVLA